MAITLILDGGPGERLAGAFTEVLPGSVIRLPTFAVPEGGLARASRWRLCVGPETGRRIRLQGWHDGLIYAISREQLDLVRRLIGPRDSLLFHDVPPARLKAAIRLALAGLTLFPPDLQADEHARPVLEGFEELTDHDRRVMAELTLGLSNLQIAARLGHAPEQVRQSVNRILRKLGCQNRTEVAVLAYGRLRSFLDLPDVLPVESEPCLAV